MNNSNLLSLAPPPSCVLQQGQTWSPSIDDEGSTRDDFYDDEDLYSGSGSGGECVRRFSSIVHAREVTHSHALALSDLDSCLVSIC